MSANFVKGIETLFWMIVAAFVIFSAGALFGSLVTWLASSSSQCAKG